MKRPVVEANFAMTVDGKISTRAYVPTGFSSARDKRRLLEIRARGDALMVGRRTLETDNMSMGLPAQDLREQRLREGRTAEPLRVIFTNRGNLRRDLKVFRSPGAPIVVFTTGAMPRTARAWLERVADVRVVGRGRGGVDLAQAMEALRSDYNVRTAVCEGGPSLLKGLLERGFLDRIFVTFAPLVFGGAGAPTLLGPASGSLMRSSVPLRLEEFEAVNDEGYAVYRVSKKR